LAASCSSEVTTLFVASPTSTRAHLAHPVHAHVGSSRSSLGGRSIALPKRTPSATL
jgi:hypothetical protein